MLTVDEEIYRLTPSLVIATVDKLAQLPWQGATGPLFGLVDSECPRHGWQNPDFSDFCGPRAPGGRWPPGETRAGDPAPAAGPDHPGRTAPDQRCSRVDGRPLRDGHRPAVQPPGPSGAVVRPVVVASTATVRRARTRRSRCSRVGWRCSPAGPGHRGHVLLERPSVTIDAGAAIPGGARARGAAQVGGDPRGLHNHGARQYLFDRYGAAADPYMTLVDYFTSTRELGGIRRLVDDDIADRLRSQQVRTRRRRPSIGELTSRMPSAGSRPPSPSWNGALTLRSTPPRRWRSTGATARRREAEAAGVGSLDVLLAPACCRSAWTCSGSG